MYACKAKVCMCASVCVSIRTQNGVRIKRRSLSLADVDGPKGASAGCGEGPEGHPAVPATDACEASWRRDPVRCGCACLSVVRLPPASCLSAKFQYLVCVCPRFICRCSSLFYPRRSDGAASQAGRQSQASGHVSHHAIMRPLEAQAARSRDIVAKWIRGPRTRLCLCFPPKCQTLAQGRALCGPTAGTVQYCRTRTARRTARLCVTLARACVCVCESVRVHALPRPCAASALLPGVEGLPRDRATFAGRAALALRRCAAAPSCRPPSPACPRAGRCGAVRRQALPAVRRI